MDNDIISGPNEPVVTSLTLRKKKIMTPKWLRELLKVPWHMAIELTVKLWFLVFSHWELCQ